MSKSETMDKWEKLKENLHLLGRFRKMIHIQDVLDLMTDMEKKS